jgi:hypothetical protein
MYLLFLTILFIISASALPAAGQTVIVDGTSNTLLVGETTNLSAPPGIRVNPGTRLRFSCSGSVQVDPGGPYYGADGGITGGYGVTANTRNIGGISAPWGSLTGVFVGDAILPTPAPLDYWSDPQSRNFTRQNPGIQQSFFIGDGTSNTLLIQETVVPPGATHLYLGVHDSGNWGENLGAITVAVTPMTNPSVIVDGTSNTLLVGETTNPSAPPGIRVNPGARLRFSCSGSVQVDPGGLYYGADGGVTGGEGVTANTMNICGISAPWGSLVGVFMGNAILPTPTPLDYWSDPNNRNFTRQNPMIQQPFFIGDGTSNTLLIQETVVPPGATHLYLGVHDSGNWGENLGALSVVVIPRAGIAGVIDSLLLTD